MVHTLVAVRLLAVTNTASHSNVVMDAGYLLDNALIDLEAGM
jgi:hypothetical protein